METSSLKFTKLKVGLTVFAGLAVFFFFIFLVGTESSVFAETYKLKLFVESSNGLNENGMVTLGGIKIGTIHEIDFGNQNGVNGIVATLNLKSKYKDKITSSSFAIIKTQGLVGDKYVDISIGLPGEQSLPENSFVPVKPTAGLESITAKIDPALDKLSNVITNLSSITDTIASGKGTVGRIIYDKSLADNLSKAADGLSRFTAAMNNKQGTLGNLVYDKTLYNNLTTLTANINSISDSLRSGKGTLGKLITSDSVYTNLNKATTGLAEMFDGAGKDSTVAAGLLKDKQMYNKFNSILNDLNGLIKDLKEHPERYINISVF